MKLINWIKKKIYTYKQEKQYKKKLAELRKRDPFTYKNF
tara:strand:- start:98 stop:214 length:117 start_codon:yes stop_codon:yes gene_type:complete